MKLSRFCLFACLFIAVLAGLRPAAAHPMGNFSINHYARFQAQTGELKLRYLLDFAEIPAVDQMAKLDTNGDGSISATEKSAYLKSEVPPLLRGLALRIDGKSVALSADSSDLQVLPGAGGLPTLLVKMDVSAALPANAQSRVTYVDSNFAGRTGWKEVVAVADASRSISGSDAATKDRSRELTIFPIDAGVVPPRQTSASFTVAAAGAGATAAEVQAPQTTAPATQGQTNSNTPQNRFTQSIAETKLTPVVIGWGLLFAFAFGAVHALSPGHGKTMVAAYLVGSRGTPRHAFLLGVVVTITHTFGVFALGFALLFASRYILPERLFPVLSALSGLLIFGVGLWLFMSRWQGLQNARSHAHSHGDGHTHSHGHEEEHSHSHDDEEHDHAHSHSHGEDGEHSHAHGVHSHSHDDEEHAHSHAHDEEHAHSHAHDEEHAHSHAHDEEHAHSHDDQEHSHSHDEEHSYAHDEHAHSHEEEHSHAHDGHTHSHDEEHEHSHAHDGHAHSHDDEHSHAHGVHVHSHGGKAHSHAVPDGPINMKTLVALGISGGIVPCPEALVVLLAAIKLHRIGYGLILIVAFSLGLAAALIAIGMLVVSARQRLTRFNALGEDSAIVRYLPLGSAAIIVLIGAALTLQATLGRF